MEDVKQYIETNYPQFNVRLAEVGLDMDKVNVINKICEQKPKYVYVYTMLDMMFLCNRDDV